MWYYYHELAVSYYRKGLSHKGIQGIFPCRMNVIDRRKIRIVFCLIRCVCIIWLMIMVIIIIWESFILNGKSIRKR